jgi:hypothetical protein
LEGGGTQKIHKYHLGGMVVQHVEPTASRERGRFCGAARDQNRRRVRVVMGSAGGIGSGVGAMKGDERRFLPVVISAVGNDARYASP